jgi:hypothetical protein
MFIRVELLSTTFSPFVDTCIRSLAASEAADDAALVIPHIAIA